MQFPFDTDGRGCTESAAVDDDDYVSALIEQVLLTAPGERVNRPDFGCGLQGMVFSTVSDATQAALQANVHAALQRWLADVIQVQDVLVEAQDSALQVTVQYVIQRTQQQQIATFTTRVGGAS